MPNKVKATLYVSEDVRQKIRNTGLTVEEYFNRLQKMHDAFCMDKWKDGVFWIQFFRICLLRADTLNLILNHIGDESLINIGREIGEKLRLTMKTNFKNALISDNYEAEIINNLNSYAGWGNFALENDVILITMPIFTKTQFIQGYLEGLLNKKLTLLESYPDRMAFKIK